ncbi:MAG: UDP-N-acetylmuramoyl-L-alanine--D-glutamate ligase [Gudongella sp.]|nr:UDP-N-acetylmuramoyl-L-alanine--D-glutamate ligase [Gudongella sp.]
MEIKNKRILIMGLGVTGVSSLKILKKHTTDIFVYDNKPIHIIEQKLKDENFLSVKIIEIDNLKELQNIDLIVKSPGIKPDHIMLQKAKEMNILVISDIELAYFLRNTQNIVGITGTNGKTTSTILAGEIFRAWGKKTFVTGNVGVGILEKIEEVKKEDVLVIELSSFQLEHTYSFRPKVALLLNITPDHLDWHKTIENYIDAKLKIFKNQTQDDYLVLNYDDPILRKLKDSVSSQTIWFSVKEELSDGIFIKKDHIVYKNEGIEEMIISLDDIKLLGKHNLENICGVIGLAKAFRIDTNIIASTIKRFKGVPHRLEFVGEHKDVKYYNDSKGTNIDSTIKAIEALEGPLVLIAGGYDKGATYDKLIDNFKNKVESLILIGQTKYLIKESALKKDIKDIYILDNMEGAVLKAIEISKPGTNVLLSPACASWDMYNCFEERGDHFKKLVMELTE